MQKYGFREGQGLGKHEQGLSTALSVEKTSKRGGKIIVGEATEKGGSSPEAGGTAVQRKRNGPLLKRIREFLTGYISVLSWASSLFRIGRKREDGPWEKDSDFPRK